jgi:outer membrane protein
MKILLLLLLGLNLIAAQNNYSLRVAVAKPTLYSAADIFMGKFGQYRDDLKAYNIDGGYLLVKDLFDWPVDLYVKGGLTYYEEKIQDDVYGADIYIKAYYNIDFWQNRVRFGVGEGASYTNRILEIEQIDAALHNDNNSHFLNYLDISLDFDLGKLISYKELNETYVGFLLKHRSGIFGTINNVRHGGSNYESIYIEKNF